MRIKIKNPNGTRELRVKVQYDSTEVKKEFSKDKYGRDVCYIWTEKVTTVTCHEHNQASIPVSMTVFVGRAICDYRDAKRFKKSTGRNIAWKNCIVEMLDKNFVTREEAIALSIVGTSGTIAEIDMTGDEINISCKM